MGTWYYGFLTKMYKTDSEVVMYVGGGQNPDETIANCKELMRKLKKLEGRKAWHCNTLRIINEAIDVASKCSKEAVLYAFITTALHVKPKIVSEYEFEDRENKVYTVDYLSEINALCDKAFPRKKSKAKK